MMLKTISLVATAFAVIAVAPASARDSSRNAPPQITINYSDLDIKRPEGAATLLKRIKKAAKEACGPAPVLRDLRRETLFDGCVNDTVDRAVASVNSTLLTELARGDQATSDAQKG